MKQILFLDDFLVNRQQNVERRFHAPTWLDEHAFSDPVNLLGAGSCAMAPAADGRHLLYVQAFCHSPRAPAPRSTVLLYRGDGLEWEPVPLANPVLPSVPNALAAERGIQGFGFLHEPDDAAQPYKGIICSDEPVARDRKLYFGHSRDGCNWSWQWDRPVHPRESDSVLPLFRNHRTGRLQYIHRNQPMDRRIFASDTADGVHWSTPRLILHPSTNDLFQTQLYGMPAFRYGDIFLGFLWLYRTSALEEKPWKNIGVVETELVYSYDGFCWNRTHRPFMTLRQEDHPGSRSMYGCCLLVRDESLYVYANALHSEHHQPFVEHPNRGVLLPGKIRLDGFASLRSTAGVGEVTTDSLFLRAPEIRLNLRTSRQGSVRVQVCDCYCQPLPGFSFDECTPLNGDHPAAAPRWRCADLLAATRGAVKCPGWVRIQIRLECAEVFSIGGDFGVSIHSGAPGCDYL